MVYLIFDPEDKFWKYTASKFFAQGRFSIQAIGHIEGTKVIVTETNIRDKENRDIMYYVGHGYSKTGKPVALKNCVRNLIDFIIGLKDQGKNIEYINFLSCYTYIWLIKKYKVFARLLACQPMIQLEGCIYEINIIYIHSMFENTSNSMEYIQLSRIDYLPVVTMPQQPSLSQRRNLATTAERTLSISRRASHPRESIGSVTTQIPTKIYRYEYVEKVTYDSANNTMNVKAPFWVFKDKLIPVLRESRIDVLW